MGGGIMAWAKLCAGLDVFGLDRKIIGFDTFEGFPSISNQDLKSLKHENLEVGKFSSFCDIEKELNDCIEEFDENRFLNHISKIELVKGDANKTIPKYIENNQHLLISLLFLDFDIYEPTKTALQYFAKRVVKGGIIAFDEINNPFWKGESIAAYEFFENFNSTKIKKFDFDPNIAYMVVE